MAEIRPWPSPPSPDERLSVRVDQRETSDEWNFYVGGIRKLDYVICHNLPSFLSFLLAALQHLERSVFTGSFQDATPVILHRVPSRVFAEAGIG